MSAAPLVPEPDRQAMLGGRMLAAVEADVLGDDPHLREHLTELAGDLHRWAIAGDQAVAVHLRLLDPRHEGYTDADRQAAADDYAFARRRVLASIATITAHLTPEEDDHR